VSEREAMPGVSADREGRGTRGRTAAVTAALIGVVAFAAAGHQVAATALHAQAWPLWSAADARFDEARDAHEVQLTRGASVVARAEALQQVLTTDLVREEDRAALEERLAEARTLLAGEPQPVPTGLVLLGDPSVPAPAWDRYADVWEITELVPARNASAARFEASADALTEAADEVADAAERLAAGSTELAAAELAANPSATYRTRLALQGLIDGTRATGIPAASAAGFTELVTAVSDVRASHAAEEARRLAFPLRGEIEAFARSLAFGVTLDFAWAYEVAGVTSDGWYAGTAEFWQEGGGWGHITLSESIGDAWDDENAKAVVVHEVGHTQVVRAVCKAIFDGPAFEGDHETWATAWAIGMGYDVPGAGIEAYGRPSPEQIAASTGCR
jgi:hypothetical protein